MSKSKANNVVFDVILPICLHLDERKFTIPYKKGTNVEIILSNFFSNEYSNIGDAKNAEVDSDIFSHYRFTRMTMMIPCFQNAVIEPKEILLKYENIFLKYYNQFIDCYRIVTGRNKIRNIWSLGEFLQPINLSASEGINPQQYQVAKLSFGDGPLVGAKPLRPDKDHLSLQEYLQHSPNLYQHFLADSKRELLFGNEIQSNINSVIALEIIVSNFIKRYAAEKQIDENSIKNFIKDVGLSGNIKTTLKLIVTNDETLPDDTTFSLCKAAITQRNHIVHDGLRSINSQEYQKQINAIEQLIEFLTL